MYVTFDMNSTFFSTQDYTLITEGSPLCGQLGFSHGGWYKVLNQAMDLSAKDNLICLLPGQNGLQRQSMAPCQTKSLPVVFPGHVACGTNGLCWLDQVLFPGGTLLFCNTISLFEPQHRAPAEFMESCLPLLMIIRDSPPWNVPWWQCKWKHRQRGFVSHHRGKDTACYFYLYKPIWTSSAHQIIFFWLRQTDSNKTPLAYVFHCDAEHLNSKC